MDNKEEKKAEEIKDEKKEEIQKDLSEVESAVNDKKEEVAEKNIKSEVSSKEENLDVAKKAVRDGTDIFDEAEMDLSAGSGLQGAGEDSETKKKEVKKDEKKQKKSKKSKKKKNKEIKKVSIGRAYVKASYNNTMVTLTDNNGNVLVSESAGQLGFKGPKKSTPYAASIIVRDIVNKVKNYGLQSVSVFVNGVGAGRESAVRALNANGLNVLSIKDITPIPHNGCRAKKPRRV